MAASWFCRDPMSDEELRAQIRLASQRELEDELKAYAETLVAVSKSTEEVRCYCRQHPQEFFEICKARLSRLIDVPFDIVDICPRVGVLQSNSRTNDLIAKLTPKSFRKQALEAVKFQSFLHCNKSSASKIIGPILPLTQRKKEAIYANIIGLIEHLSSDDKLKTEMVFRKTGNINRQLQLRAHILSSHNVTFPFVTSRRESTSSSVSISSDATPSLLKLKKHPKLSSVTFESRDENAELTLKTHDYANTLKVVLREMPDPVLTVQLLPIFNALAKITQGNVDENGVRVPLSAASLKVAEAKQLMGLRILRLLLPEVNQKLLRCLLELLTKTLNFSDVNGMSAQSLGTVFGPILFSPSCCSQTELHNHYDALIGLATMMIEHGAGGIFAIPAYLHEDIHDSQVTPRTGSKDSGVDTISTGSSASCALKLEAADTESDQEHSKSEVSQSSAKNLGNIGDHSWRSGVSFTEYSVAKLCAVVQSLPESDSMRQAVMRRMKKTNVNLFPTLGERIKCAITTTPLPPKIQKPVAVPETSLSVSACKRSLNAYASQCENAPKYPKLEPPKPEFSGGEGSDDECGFSEKRRKEDVAPTLCCSPLNCFSGVLRKGERRKNSIASVVYLDMGAEYDENIHLFAGHSPSASKADDMDRATAFSSTHKPKSLRALPVLRNYNHDSSQKPKLILPTSSEMDAGSAGK